MGWRGLVPLATEEAERTGCRELPECTTGCDPPRRRRSAWPSRREAKEVSASMRLGATRALLLNRWTRHRPIRAEHAAVTIFRLEATAAPRAVIEELAGVGGHRLGGLMPASRARDGGREYHPANLARANRRSRTANSN